MSPSPHAVVTGAFSYTGSAVTAELLARGWRVTTLTNRTPARDSPKLHAQPLRFDRDHLTRVLANADVLVNTYWIRLPSHGTTFDDAVANTLLLFDAARDAGVARIVQTSVSNAKPDSPLAYYRGKAQIDARLATSGTSHAIVRPTLIVGPRDVLTNNIAWFLRRFPLFALPDGGDYRLQPVTLADTGRIMADAVESPDPALDVDAAGPDTLSFRQYVTHLAHSMARSPRMVSLPGWLTVTLLQLPRPLLRDVVLSREELLGLQHELLTSHAPPLGRESVLDWLAEHGNALGRSYVNDRRRHAGTQRSTAVSQLPA